MFSLISAWINVRVNNGETGDLRRHGAHYAWRHLNVSLDYFAIPNITFIHRLTIAQSVYEAKESNATAAQPRMGLLPWWSWIGQPYRYPLILTKSVPLIWRSGTRRRNLWVIDRHTSCSVLREWEVIGVVTTAMGHQGHMSKSTMTLIGQFSRLLAFP